MIFLTEDLINSVKVRAMVPISQQTFSDSDIVSLANEELALSLVPDLISVREDFFLEKTSVPVLSGVDEYAIPQRATGNALKDIFYVDPSGNRRSLPRLKVHDVPVYSMASSEPWGFYLKGDEVVITPKPATAQGSLEFYFMLRPNRLVEVGKVGKILSIATNGANTEFTVNADITTLISQAGGLVDFLNSESPFLLWAYDVLPTSSSSTVISVPTAKVVDASGALLPSVGDYVCPAQTAPIPMVPQEMHPILAQMVAARMCEALGHLDKLGAVNAKLSEMRKQALHLVANRVESALEHVKNRHGIASYLGRYHRGQYTR